MHQATTVLHKDMRSHHANLMIQYMVAQKFKKAIPALELSNFNLPQWNISHPGIEETEHDKICTISDTQLIDFQRITYLAEAGIYSRFHWRGYGQRMEYFPPKQECRDFFVRSDVQVRPLGDDVILCAVRGAEILNAIHPGYTVIPIDFYSEIIEETRLVPVFMGQLGDNPYTRALKARFPKAEFLPRADPVVDFQTIRSATNLIVPVSTFGWLAAWLSHARKIVLPVFGIFNPKLFPRHDLLPLSESAYDFYEFPPQASVPLAELLNAHAQIRGQWRRVQAQELARP